MRRMGKKDDILRETDGGSSTTCGGESGMALLMVLGVLAAVMVMLSHLILITQVVSRESYQIAGSEELRYQAESAAETAFWLHLTDRRLVSNRTLGQTEEDNARIDADYPPWMLDGRPHEFDDGQTVVYLQSGENGTKISNLRELKTGLDASEDADAMEMIDNFIAAYQDYVDADDLTRVNGFENNDYAAEGFPTLPRNAAMQFKQELYWLPGWRDVLTREICIVPPSKISYSFTNNGKPSFFAASDETFCSYLDIEPDSAELEAIHEAIRAWREENVAIEDSLDFTLLTTIKSKFSFAEPGLGIIAAIAYDAQRENHARYQVTREAKISSKTFYADSHKQCFSIWERLR